MEMAELCERVAAVVEEAYAVRPAALPEPYPGGMIGRGLGLPAMRLTSTGNGLTGRQRLVFKSVGIAARPAQAIYATQLMAHLSTHLSEVAVPRLITPRSGHASAAASPAPLVEFEVDGRQLLCVLEHEVPGEWVGMANATVAHRIEAARVAGAVQRALAGWRPRTAPYRWKSRRAVAKEEILPRLLKLESTPMDRELQARVLRVVRAQLQHFTDNWTDAIDDALVDSHIHNDLKADNILFKPDTDPPRACSLFDFNMAQADHRIVEFSNLLFGTRNPELDHQQFQDVVGAFEMGLRTTLKPEERVAAWEVLRLRLCENLAKWPLNPRNNEAADMWVAHPEHQLAYRSCLELLQQFGSRPMELSGVLCCFQPAACTLMDLDEGNLETLVRLLAPPAPFASAQSFSGVRKGCTFKLGVLGLGYYADAKLAAKTIRQTRSMTLVSRTFHRIVGPVMRDLRVIAARDSLDAVLHTASEIKRAFEGRQDFESLADSTAVRLRAALEEALAAGVPADDEKVLAAKAWETRHITKQQQRSSKRQKS